MSDYILRSNNYDKEVRHKSVEDIYSQYHDNRQLYQQNVSDLHEWQHDAGTCNLSPHQDGASYFNELEKILSTQMHILKIARKNALKVKGSCGISQRPYDQSRARNEAVKTNRLMNSTWSSVRTESPEQCTNTTEPNDDIPMEVNCVENTIPYLETPNDRSGPLQFTGNRAVQEQMKCRSNIDAFEHEEQRSGQCMQTHVIQSEGQKKERVLQRKATHNKIEKRRRSFINDRIVELRRLLPESVNRKTCKNKGSILKESVEYIKKLHTDLNITRQLQEKIIEIDLESKQHGIRLEMLEMRSDPNTGKNSGVQNKPHALAEPKGLSFDSVLNKHKPLPKVIQTVSQTIALDNIWDTLASTFQDECTQS